MRRSPRFGGSPRNATGRFIRDWEALQRDTPFFALWAGAAIDEMLSALYERLVVGARS